MACTAKPFRMSLQGNQLSQRCVRTIHLYHDQVPVFKTSLRPCCSAVSGNLCRVTGGVLGIHWSSVITMGWHPLADGRRGATCWESCCLKPNCDAVWSLGGRCVLLRCARARGCPIASLPQPHQESLGLLQLLSKVQRRDVPPLFECLD